MSAFTEFDALFDSGAAVPPSADASGNPVTAPSVSVRVTDGAVTKEHALGGEAFEGASNYNRNVALWQPPVRSADRDILPQKRQADARVRDTIRNDAYIQAGQNLHKDNIVGGQFILNAKPMTKIIMGKEDDTWEEEFQEEVETLFTLWAESDQNWVDSGRRNNFTMMIRQVVGTYLATGEVLGVVDWAKPGRTDKPFSTSIRLVDLDRLTTPLDRLNDPYVIGGVEVEKASHAPLAYYMRKAHPSEVRLPESREWVRVEARKPWGRPQAIHLFEQQRANQTRGMSEITAALKEMRQTKDFRDVMLQNAVLNATYAATVESDLDIKEVFARLGAGNLGEDGNTFAEGVADLFTGWLGAVAAYTESSKQLQMNGARIPVMPPGSKLNLQPASKGGPLGTEFEQSLLRHIAASLGVSYEQLSRDYTDTNYSSARAAMAETWKFMNSRKKVIADRFANIVYRLWLEEALNRGVITSMPARMRGNTDWLYQPLIMDAITEADWIGGSRGQIDEVKETQAATLRLKSNLTTLEEESAKLGNDWRTVLKQRKREQALMEKYGLVMEEDNSINASTGTPSEAQDLSEDE